MNSKYLESVDFSRHERWLSRTLGPEVVLLHGGVLDIINRFVRGNPLEMSRDFLIPNAGINWVSTVDGQWTLESWGETAHLAPGALDELPS